MTNLVSNHRIRIPNKLAIFAALLLLVSSVVGYETTRDINSSAHSVMPSSQVDSADNGDINDTGEHKGHGLNLGLLLFRR